MLSMKVILKLHRRLAPVTVGLIPEDKSQDQAVVNDYHQRITQIIHS